MSRLTRDGTAEPVSRDPILRHARGQGHVHFPCSADHEQDWQPYPVDPYSARCDDHTPYILSYLIIIYYIVFGWFWLLCYTMYYYIIHCFCLLKGFWCPCMAAIIVNSVQYNGGLLPDIILLTQCNYHWGTRFNAMMFCLCGL